MPGLAGFVSREGAPTTDRAALTAMRDLLGHTATRHDELFADGTVAATRCHTDLLQPQLQPCARAGRYLWLDGELYNRAEVAPQASSDAEALLYLHRRDGDHALVQLDGLYTAVLYDPTTHQLHLINNRYGLRPLYWTQHRGRLAWASELKALLALPDFVPRLDRQALESFLAVGYLDGDRTWFEGIQRLPAATRLSWDLQAHTHHFTPYWSWDQVPPLSGRPSQGDLAAELGELFTAAVARRCQGDQRVGLVLSGGLDSRAILAAAPHPPVTATFGRPDSPDARLAARAARRKGARHHLLELQATDWLAPRLDAVWHTDGMLDILHMHGVETFSPLKGYFSIALNGAGGDGLAGGGHLFAAAEFDAHLQNRLGLEVAHWPQVHQRLKAQFARAGSAHAFYIDHRMRSFTVYGPLMGTFKGLEYRLPFLDNAFQEKLFAVPTTLKKGNQLYRRMLLQAFPRFYRTIPWATTGVPLTWPAWTGRLLRGSRRLLGQSTATTGLDYAAWLRQSPARDWVAACLLGREALYPDYIDRQQVQTAWEVHLAGHDQTVPLGRYLTVEIFLQQVFARRWRSGGLGNM
ncbi:MAG: hypothetical protein GKR89_21820 [Candidatus Latescibacteria bacterium]|nr:hypothetical protein [Candidatus Latescibacterota bacterium]